MLPIRNTSKEANRLEDQYYLSDGLFSISTLQFIMDKLTTFYNIPEIKVRLSKTLGTSKGRYQILGKLRYSHYYTVQGKRRSKAIDIMISPKGRTLAITIHEFAHYHQMEDKGYSNHNGPWQRGHEAILRTFVDQAILTFNQIELEEKLGWYWINFPTLFNSFWYEGISGRELLKKLDYIRLQTMR